MIDKTHCNNRISSRINHQKVQITCFKHCISERPVKLVIPVADEQNTKELSNRKSTQKGDRARKTPTQRGIEPRIHPCRKGKHPKLSHLRPVRSIVMVDKDARSHPKNNAISYISELKTKISND